LTWPPRRELPALGAIVLLGALVRAPFWAVALRTDPDGDTAIVGLMARHLGEGRTLWGQPYGSPLDAWVAAPFVAFLAPSTLALRLPYALLSLALVPLAWALARRLDERAGLPAALVAAVPPAFFLLLSALPPPFYPTVLVLLGAVLLIVTREELRTAHVIVAGLLAGLALWTHLVALAVLVPCAIFLAWRAPRRALGFVALAALPWLALRDPAAASGVGWGGAGPALDHARGIGSQVPALALRLLGSAAPYTEGDPDLWARAPLAVAVLLGGVWAALVGLAAWRARGGVALLLAGCALLTLLLFPLSQRSGPDTLRFLTPLWLPLLALVLGAAARASGARGAWLAAGALVALQIPASAALARAWYTDGPWQPLVPACRGIATGLERLGVRHAYASYNTAWCLSYVSGERVIASQPWNERFPGYPLPFLERVRGSSDAAWVFVADADFDMPPPRVMAAKLGDHCQRATVGPATILHDCRAPFDPAGERRPVGFRGRGPQDVDLGSPAALAGITLQGELPPSFTLEVSADRAVYEPVLRRRPDRQRLDPVWVNGHPQLVWQDDVASAPLGGRTVSALRVTPADPARDWALDAVVLHAR
jgi:hypothetical protein